MTQTDQDGLAKALNSLPQLSSNGCGVPMAAAERAKYLRQKTIEGLWNERQDEDGRARVLALVAAQTEAHWWCTHPTTEHATADFRRRLASGRVER